MAECTTKGYNVVVNETKKSLANTVETIYGFGVRGAFEIVVLKHFNLQIVQTNYLFGNKVLGCS